MGASLLFQKAHCYSIRDMQVKIDKHDYRTFTIDKEKSHLSNQPQFSEQIPTRPDKYSGDLNTKIR